MIRFILFMLVIGATACTKIPIFEDLDGPIFINNDLSDIRIGENENIVVSSYNIEFGERIDEAIDVIQSDDKLLNAHIILLQEVDEHGVEDIAQTLGYNFVYYPISFEEKHQRNLGNAILSKLKFVSTEKIILPYAKFNNGRKRSVTTAVVEIAGSETLILSTHLETVVMNVIKRKQQLEAINDFIESRGIESIILGGDLNALVEIQLNEFARIFDDVDLVHATKGIGQTSKSVAGILHPTNDHIFVRGFESLDIGKVKDETASDHFPIWVELGFL